MSDDPTPLPGLAMAGMQGGLGPPIPEVSLKERLERTLAFHQDKIKEIKEALDTLKKNPELEKAVKAFQNVGIY